MTCAVADAVDATDATDAVDGARGSRITARSVNGSQWTARVKATETLMREGTHHHVHHTKDASDEDSVIMNLKVSAGSRGGDGAPEAYNVPLDTATTVPLNGSIATVTNSGTEWRHDCSDIHHRQRFLPPSNGNVLPEQLTTDHLRSGAFDTEMGASSMSTSSSTTSTMPMIPTAGATSDGGGGGPRIVTLLRDFAERTRTTGEWPASTSVCCYWCCHRFTGAPFGLPVKLVGRYFHATGCFCSLECATAYNFGCRDSTDQALERYTLINALAARLGLLTGVGRCAGVRPAPDRLALQMFGGHLDIDAFRKFCETGRHVLVNTAPMQTLTTQLEEVPEADMRSEYRYVPLDMQRVTRFQEKIRLRRRNPLVNPRNTLDSTMNLRYVTAGGEGVGGVGIGGAGPGGGGGTTTEVHRVPSTMGALPASQPSTSVQHHHHSLGMSGGTAMSSSSSSNSRRAAKGK